MTHHIQFPHWLLVAGLMLAVGVATVAEAQKKLGTYFGGSSGQQYGGNTTPSFGGNSWNRGGTSGFNTQLGTGVKRTPYYQKPAQKYTVRSSDGLLEYGASGTSPSKTRKPPPTKKSNVIGSYIAPTPHTNTIPLNIFPFQPQQPVFPRQDNDSGQRVYSQPGTTRNQSYITPRPAPVKLQANAEPPEMINSALANAEPGFEGLEPIDAESHRIVGELVEEQANKSVDRLEEQLGDAANNPAVADKVQEMRDKIALGEMVSEQDIDELGQLLQQVDPAKFPPGFDPNNLTGPLNDIISMSEANELMKQQVFPDGGLLGGFPTGQVMTMPALPEDEMLLLPGGCMMVGTGGEGTMGIADYDARELLDINLGVGEPEPDSDCNVAKRVKSGVYLINPSDNAATINYVTANTNYSMQPGFTQMLPEGRNWEIQFNRGEGKGDADYALSDGTYTFGTADGGWELFKQSCSITIDNGDNDRPFYFNIDNDQEEVAARAKQTFSSEYPILVRFDRGSGGDPAQKRITKKDASLVVAVNTSDGLWDLYPERNFEGIARKSNAKNSNVRQTLLREQLRLSMER